MNTQLESAPMLPQTAAGLKLRMRKARRAHNLEVGLTLAAAGIKVFTNLDKTPLVAAWQQDGDALSSKQKMAIRDAKQAESPTSFRHKFVGSTSNPDLVRAMLRECPDATFSIALGINGLICLDADLPKEKRPLNGPTEIAKMYAENGGGPEGVFVNGSQSGAEHHIFANPLGLPTKGVLASRSIDIKGGGLTADSGGGQIVAPGSLRKDGKIYGTLGAAKRFAEAYQRGLPALPDFVAQMIGKDAPAKTTDGDTPEPRDENSDSAEIVALTKSLREQTQAPDVSGFDLDALQIRNSRFADLMMTPPGESKASDRLSFLNHLITAFAEINAHEALALMKQNPDVCGKLVTGRQKKGEFDLRNSARDFLRAKRDIYTGDATSGEVFGNVVDLDDFRPGLKPMTDDREKRLKQKQADLQTAHSAKVKARDAAKAVEAETVVPLDSDDAKVKKLAKKSERLHKLFDCLADMPDVENDSVAWGIKHVTALRTTSIMVGMWGAGKSAIAIDMGFAQSIGCPWGNKKTVHGVVVYVALENHGDIKRRLRALRRRAIQEGKDVSGCAFVIWHAPIGLFAEDGNPTTGERDLIDVALLNAERFGLPVVQIIVDTVAKSRGAGNENDATDAGLYIKSLDRIANATGANVMALHHPSKNSESARGSGAYEADCDTVLNVSKVNGACTLKASDIKFRIGDPSKVKFSYRLHSEMTGTDEDGDPITVVLATGVEPADAKPKSAGSAHAADDDGLLVFSFTDGQADREQQVVEHVFAAEADRQRPDDISATKAQRQLELGMVQIERLLNPWRKVVGLTPLGRSSVQDIVLPMVASGKLAASGRKGRPTYRLPGGAG